MKDSNPIQYGMNWLKTDGVLVKLLFDKLTVYRLSKEKYFYSNDKTRAVFPIQP